MIHQLDAEQIAFALDKPRRVGADRYQACCPAHDDKSPSFSITQKDERVLFYCFAGCSQGEVIDALRSLGLWPEEREPAKVETLVDREEMQAFCQAHENMLRRIIPTTSKARRLYRQYQRVLYSPFTPGEVIEMHLFCLLYKADVRAEKPTTTDDDAKFMAYQKVVYNKGVPYAW